MTAHPNSFDPSVEDSRAFRDALGRFATGVTVVTCASDAGPQGMTVNSFTSLSLTPPLVLWCPAKSANRHDMFTKAAHFSIHILSDAQKDLCIGFAKDTSPFDTIDWQADANGTPILANTIARFDCTHHAVHDGGDHSILVGRVVKVELGAGDPLVYYQGRFLE